MCVGKVSSKNDPTDKGESKNEICEGMASSRYETQWTGGDKNGCLVGWYLPRVSLIHGVRQERLMGWGNGIFQE